MSEVIEVGEQLYVLAASSRLDTTTRVLKQGDTFALFDRRGDLAQVGVGELGIYHEDMRHLSRLELRIDEQRPMLLNSTVTHDTALLSVDLSNPDLCKSDGEVYLPSGLLHIHRAMLLRNAVYEEELQLTNFSQQNIRFSLSFDFDADFADLFEVRRYARTETGLPARPVVEKEGAVLAYTGLDNVTRRTRFEYSIPPSEMRSDRVRFDFDLQPREQTSLFLTIACEARGEVPQQVTFRKALARLDREMSARRETACEIVTSNEQFNDWLDQSGADLNMLVSETRHGPYPYAGIPWFSTAFGRDGLITALQYLWVNPQLARGVLSFLAAHQGEKVNPDREEEPGKILHETRKGELASIGAVPFDRYYGTVDATPLFVVLTGAYYRRTGDTGFMRELWPHVRRALDWIDQYGDMDGDGFVEYQRHGERGLLNQGWKDSDDCIMHSDGTLAQGSIALSEVQGYVYAAKRIGAYLAELMGEAGQAQALWRQASALKARFQEAFWLDDLNTYAIALDGDKRPCRVRSSNAGHALFSGIAASQYADRLSETLMSDASFCGWGIRTLAETEARYNPMSYHNGSVWPHDNALIGMGMARYGQNRHALRILNGLFQASMHMDLNRLPELFCGFPMREREGPTAYPVACAPQAWSSTAVFSLLQASLGLTFMQESPRVRFMHPVLPPYLNWVEVRNLQVGDSVMDLMLRRHQYDVGINVLHKKGSADVAVVV